MTDQEPKYLVVHTAKQMPTWMSWGTYAIIVTNTWLADTGNNWYLYGVSAIALGMTYLFYTTYRATVNMYNDKIVSAAIEKHYPNIMKGTTKVDTSHEVTALQVASLERYHEALTWINEKGNTLGTIRDKAWRALNHTEITQAVKDNAKPEIEIDIDIGKGDDNESEGT